MGRPRVVVGWGAQSELQRVNTPCNSRYQLLAISHQLMDLAAALAQRLFARCGHTGGAVTGIGTKSSSHGGSPGPSGDGRSTVLCSSFALRRPDASCQRRLDVLARPECSQNVNRIDRLERKLRWDVVGDGCQAKYPYLQRLAGLAHRLQVTASVVLQAEHQLLARHRLLDRLGVCIQLVADCRADEVGTVLVEALLHQQIDLSEVHQT